MEQVEARSLPSLIDHEERISEMEEWRGHVDRSLADISKEQAAMRAEGNVRADENRSSMAALHQGLNGLTRQLAEKTGAQNRENELKLEELQAAKINAEKWKRRAAIAGIIAALGGMVGGTLLSSQTWDDYFFGNVGFLHRHKHVQDQS